MRCSKRAWKKLEKVREPARASMAGSMFGEKWRRNRSTGGQKGEKDRMEMVSLEWRNERGWATRKVIKGAFSRKGERVEYDRDEGYGRWLTGVEGRKRGLADGPSWKSAGVLTAVAECRSCTRASGTCGRPISERVWTGRVGRPPPPSERSTRTSVKCKSHWQKRIGVCVDAGSATVVYWIITTESPVRITTRTGCQKKPAPTDAELD